MGRGIFFRRMLPIIGIFFVVLLPSCKTKEYVPVETVREEIRTETDTIERVKLVQQYAEKETEPSDTSRLENEYMYSEAYYDGVKLHHNLGTKPGAEVEVKAKKITITKTVTKREIVKVNELTAKQRLLQRYGAISLGIETVALVIFLLYLLYIRKKNR